MTQLAIAFPAASASRGEFFNTTHLAGGELAQRRRKAATQEDAVLALYRVHERLGPSQACEMLAYTDWPITSIRRAVNSLTKRGDLVKLSMYRMGPKGAREHLWALPVRGVAA